MTGARQGGQRGQNRRSGKENGEPILKTRMNARKMEIIEFIKRHADRQTPWERERDPLARDLNGSLGWTNNTDILDHTTVRHASRNVSRRAWLSLTHSQPPCKDQTDKQQVGWMDNSHTQICLVAIRNTNEETNYWLTVSLEGKSLTDWNK